MTDAELAQAIYDTKGVVTVTMSKDGCFLRAGERQDRITEDQAEVVFLALKDLHRSCP